MDRLSLLARRVVASMIDAALFFGLLYISLTLADRDPTTPAWLKLAVPAFATWMIESGSMWSSGQSIGKRCMQLRVIHTYGAAASTLHIVLVRNLPFLLLLLIPYVGAYFYLVDAASIVLPDRRCLHDRLANTLVVDARTS